MKKIDRVTSLTLKYELNLKHKWMWQHLFEREKGQELATKIVDWIANWIKEKSNETGVFHLFKDV